MGFPSLRLDGVPPFQDWMGYPPIQTGWGTHPVQDWIEYPHPHQETDQHSEHLLCSRWYASGVHHRRTFLFVNNFGNFSTLGENYYFTWGDIEPMRGELPHKVKQTLEHFKNLESSKTLISFFGWKGIW